MATKRDGFGHTLRRRIDAARAVDRLNQAIAGEVELTGVQLGAIKVALGKVLPDLAAVQVSTDHDGPATLADVHGLLLAAGLKPDAVLPAIVDGVQSEPVESDGSHDAQIMDANDGGGP